MAEQLDSFERRLHSKMLAHRTACGCSTAPLLAQIEGLRVGIRKFPDNEPKPAELAAVVCTKCGFVSLFAEEKQ